MMILGIKIDIRCNEEFCPFMYISAENFCHSCKNFIPIEPFTIMDELYKLKAEYEEKGKKIISINVNNDTIEKIYTKELY